MVILGELKRYIKGMDQIQYEERHRKDRRKQVVEKPSSFQVLEVEKFLVITKLSTWVAKVEQSGMPFFFFFFSLSHLSLHLWNMEVPRLGAESEMQLQA